MVDALFDPIAIGDVTVSNRVVMPAMTTHYATDDGQATDQTIEYYRERAKGGTGLIIFEAVYPCEPHPDRHLLTSDKYIDGLRAVVDAVHAAGSKIAIQLNPSRATGDEYDPVAPSDVTVPGEDVPENRKEVRGLMREEIDRFVRTFGEGAARAKRAGFDAIEIHGASGYLVHQFFSPVTNDRTDEYGGTLEARTKFARDLVSEARDATDGELPVWIRMAGDEFLDGGFGEEDAKRIAKRLEEAGSAAIHVTAGHQWSEGQAYGILTGYEPRGLNVHLAENVGSAVDVPVMAVGRINDPRLAAEIVEDGRADLVAMGRAHIADPHFVNKAKNGKLNRIRRCVGGLEGCRDMVFPNYPESLSSGMGVSCTVNAVAGYERETETDPAENTKRVVVVGGGPAGLEAARIAGKRGHDVTIFEKRDRIGGQVRWMANTPTKAEHGTLLEFFEAELDAYGVRVRNGTPLEPTEVPEMDVDELIVATGSEQPVPTIRGLSGAAVDGHVLTVEDVLTGTSTGDPVVVLGGTEAATDVAMYLSHEGVHATVIVGPDEDLLPLRSPITKKGFEKRLRDQNVDVLMDTSVREIVDDEIRVFDVSVGERQDVGYESIVLAGERKPNREFKEEKLSAKMTKIGDVTGSTDLYTAIHQGAEVGRQI